MSEIMIKPINSQILIKVDEPDAVTFDGIIIPEAYRKEQNQGDIISIGDKAVNVNNSLQIGRKAIFPIGGGQPVKIMDEDYVLLDETMVIAVL